MSFPVVLLVNIIIVVILGLIARLIPEGRFGSGG